jgi:hypothetical protein
MTSAPQSSLAAYPRGGNEECDMKHNSAHLIAMTANNSLDQRDPRQLIVTQNPRRACVFASRLPPNFTLFAIAPLTAFAGSVNDLRGVVRLSSHFVSANIDDVRITGPPHYRRQRKLKHEGCSCGNNSRALVSRGGLAAEKDES